MTKGKISIEFLSDNSLSISIEDYGVELFDGMDYEFTYIIKEENIDNFCNKLGCTKENVKEKIIEVFGESLEKQSINNWLKANNIKYDLHSWIS